MPRKTKEAIEEKKDVENKSTTAKKSDELASSSNLAMNLISKVKEVTTKATSKKSAKKSSDTEKATKATKKSSKSTKTSKVKEENADIVETVESKKKTSKKTTVSKTTKSKTTSAKKSTKKDEKADTEKKPRKRKTKKVAEEDDVDLLEIDTLKTAVPMEVEYYDLPYKYNQTVVKVLYQNPTTLFVYWEISDNDIENYKKTYGENFFETTEPVLTVFNDTMHYQFEIVINDFANSWYFTINDSKCHYHVELGRRPRYNNYNNDYIYITTSNTIESPNDRILFNTNEDNSIYFRNIKNNTLRKVKLPKLIAQLNLNNKKFGFPLIKNSPDLYTKIYQVEDISEFDTLSNPSSGNPSSGSLSSRFK